MRTEYLSSLRFILTKPLRQAEENPKTIESLLGLMQEYCISREQLDYVLSVTSFKTKGAWGEDPMKEVPTKIKSAFTRAFNQTGQVRCRTNESEGVGACLFYCMKAMKSFLGKICLFQLPPNCLGGEMQLDA